VPVPVRGAKQRALLALLALRPGQPVSADRLIDVLWGDGQAFEQLVAQGRRLAEAGSPRTRPPPWAKRSGCGAASRWPTSLMRAFLMPNGRGWTS
jgi:hypothetical protein